MARPHSFARRSASQKKDQLSRNLYLRGSTIWCKFRMAGREPVNCSTGIHIDDPGAIRDAEQMRDDMRANIRAWRPALSGDAVAATTLRGVADLWLAHGDNAKTKEKVIRAATLCAHFGDNVPPESITSAAVEQYVRTRLAMPSRIGGLMTPNTIKREVSILRSILNYGAGERYFRPVPFNIPRHLLIIRAADKKITAGKLHEPAKMARFTAALPADLRALFTFARLTGARIEELLRSRRSEVKLTGNADVPATITLLAPETKGRTARTLQLNRAAWDALQVGLGSGHPERIWALKLTNVEQRMSRTNKKLGYARGETITFRDARHEVATRMYNSGVPIRIVMEQLGHLHMVTTERYIHAPTDAREAALRAYWVDHGTTDLAPGLSGNGPL